MAKQHPWWQRLAQHELFICLYFNQLNHQPRWRRFFGLISRLGDGIFWYALMALLLFWYWPLSLWPIVQSVLTGLSALALYLLLKKNTHRLRPIELEPNLLQSIPPLDRYSFPSGHTLHAVAFSSVLAAHFPSVTWLVWGFTALVALSRLVLGLHFPTDVLVAIVLGALLAGLSFFLYGILLPGH
jgi:undecaprenyl-diphosphatase